MSEVRPLELQVCRQCSQPQYPVREICKNCLGGELELQPVDGSGELLSWTRLHASLEPLFSERLPWVVVAVQLRAGPVVLAHWAGDEPAIGQAVEVRMIRDPEGRLVLAAIPDRGDPAAAGRLFDARA